MFSTVIRGEPGANRFRVLPRGWRRVALGTGVCLGRVVMADPDASDLEVLDAACQAALRERTRVSVAAPRQLEAALSLAMGALGRSGVAPDRLELLVPAHVAAVAGMEALLSLSALRDRGVGVALSGAGVESGPLLMRLPLSALVLGAELAAGLPGSAATVLGLVDAARAFETVVVAAGVETEAQRAMLAGLGCHAGEGELFGGSG